MQTSDPAWRTRAFDRGPIKAYRSFRHHRNFLDCVKSRAQPRTNADVACQTHIACHAVNIAIFLGRKLAYDPQKNEFLDDEQANRLRGDEVYRWSTISIDGSAYSMARITCPKLCGA